MLDEIFNAALLSKKGHRIACFPTNLTFATERAVYILYPLNLNSKIAYRMKCQLFKKDK